MWEWHPATELLCRDFSFPWGECMGDARASLHIYLVCPHRKGRCTLFSPFEILTMRLSLLTSLCLTAIGALSQQTPGTYTPAPPPPPGLTFLYTCYAICDNRLYTTQGPRGLRTTIPIIGGNFTGPRLRGQILDVGADWGVTDPQTGIFSADTRYNFLTDDGANIFLQTSGPAQPDGSLHLRGVFETGDKNYYWLNNIVGKGERGLSCFVED